MDEEFTNFGQGRPYAEAIIEADREERKERRRAGDVRKATGSGAVLPAGESMHEKMWKRLENGVTVWIDDTIVEQERGYILLHDALAAEGWAS